MKQARHRAISAKTFYALDGMRGLAAIIIFFRHVNAHLPGYTASCSFLAVDFFFCLSGFVIAHAYEHRLSEGMSPVEFMKQRIIRLYPLALLALLIAGITSVLTPAGQDYHADLPAFAASMVLGMLFIPAPHAVTEIGRLWTLNPPGWSILCEITVNACFAFFFKGLTTRRLAAVAALGAAGIVVSAVVYHSLDLGYALSNLFGGMSRVFFAFPLGIIIYRNWRTAPQPSNLPVHFSVPALILIAALIAPVPPQWQIVYAVATIFAVVPALIAFAARIDVTGRFASAILLYLGSISYAVYILQDPIRRLTRTIVLTHFHADQKSFSVTTALIGLACFFLICAVVDCFYDRPVRQKLKRFFAGHSSTVTPPVAIPVAVVTGDTQAVKVHR